MKLFSLTIGLSAALFGTAGATAQDTWTGTRLPGNGPAGLASTGVPPMDALDEGLDVRTDVQARQTAYSLATCLVGGSSANVQTYLNASGKQAESRALSAMHHQMELCMRPSMGSQAFAKMEFNRDSLHAVLADAWLQRKAHDLPPAVPMQKVYDAPWFSTDANQKIVDNMAMCVAATHPDAVDAFLRSRPATPEERAAFSGVAPFLGPCLVSNATVKMSLSPVRLSLAKAYYYRIYDPAPDAATHEKK